MNYLVYKNCGVCLILTFSLSLIGGCKKFVIVDPPSTVLVMPSVFNNDNTANSAMTSVYTQMINDNQESYNVSLSSGLLADELTSYSSDGQVMPYFLNAMTGSIGFTSTLYYGRWKYAYNYIYKSNDIIEGLRDIQGTSLRVNQQLTGEAKFVRAFWYFYLTNCYGNVPLATTTDYTINGQLPRALSESVYNQIITDLNDAKKLLDTNYVDATGIGKTIEKGRPNKVVASALLARVYLYANKYDSAEQEATTIISNNIYSLLPNLSDVFLANSEEAIWQLAQPNPGIGYNEQTLDGRFFILNAAPDNYLSYNTAQLSSWLMNSFEPGDSRKTTWINSITFDATTYYFPFKYQVYDNDNNPNGRTEYTMVLRLAEQYLIRAEARAQQNNLAGALEDLNAVRHRAGLTDYTGAVDKDAILAAILHERQVELFAEWGHRWFDLIRTNNINSVMGAPGNVTQQKGGVWEPFKSLYPIPQSEINSDSHLTQNPGYN